MAKKQPKEFNNSFRLRIYDVEVVKSLNELFKTGKYSSMNELLSYAVGIGVEKIYLEFGKRKLLVQDRAVPETSDTQKIDTLLHEMSKFKILQEDTFIMMNSIEALTASVFNIQRAGIAGEPISTELIDSGYYNALPENFKEMKDNLVARFNRRLTKVSKKETE